MTSCFVIGPIGDSFGEPNSPGKIIYEEALEVLEKVIEPACEANGLTAIRADQISRSGDINEQVFKHLRDDDIVIADVSGGNANVMYELGARHTTNKLTIQLGEYKQLPFDIRTVRTIQFSRSRRGLIDARNELEQAIATGLAEGPEELPIYRIWNVSPNRVVVPTADGDPLDDDNDGLSVAPLIDSLADAEAAFPEFVANTQAITEVFEEIAALVRDAGDATTRADSRSGSAAARLAIVGKLAQELSSPSEQLEVLVKQYDVLLGRIGRAMFSIFANLDGSPEEADDPRMQEFLRVVRELAASSREAMENVNVFGTSAEGMSGVSKRLRVPGRRLSTAVRDMAKATARIDEWDRRASSYLTVEVDADE